MDNSTASVLWVLGASVTAFVVVAGLGYLLDHWGALEGKEGAFTGISSGTLPERFQPIFARPTERSVPGTQAGTLAGEQLGAVKRGTIHGPLGPSSCPSYGLEGCGENNCCDLYPLSRGYRASAIREAGLYPLEGKWPPSDDTDDWGA